MGESTRSTQCRGVKVKVVRKRTTFDLFVHIDMGTNLAKKRSNSQFHIKIKDKTGIVTQKEINLSFPDQPYNSGEDILKFFKKKFYILGNIECRLALAPTFYLHNSMMRDYHISEKTAGKKPKKKSVGFEVVRHRTSGNSVKYSGRGPVPYTNSNPFKPYQGGGFSPR